MSEELVGKDELQDILISSSLVISVTAAEEFTPLVNLSSRSGKVNKLDLRY